MSTEVRVGSTYVAQVTASEAAYRTQRAAEDAEGTKLASKVWPRARSQFRANLRTALQSPREVMPNQSRVQVHVGLSGATFSGSYPPSTFSTSLRELIARDVPPGFTVVDVRVDSYSGKASAIDVQLAFPSSASEIASSGSHPPVLRKLLCPLLGAPPVSAGEAHELIAKASARRAERQGARQAESAVVKTLVSDAVARHIDANLGEWERYPRSGLGYVGTEMRVPLGDILQFPHDCADAWEKSLRAQVSADLEAKLPAGIRLMNMSVKEDKRYYADLNAPVVFTAYVQIDYHELREALKLR